MLLTVLVITILVLSTNTLVFAEDQCTPFYPGRSCEEIIKMNLGSDKRPGYYWLIDSPTLVYCGMNYTGKSCVDVYKNNPETGDKDGYYPINKTQWTFCNMTAIAASAAAAISNGNSIILSCAGVGGEWKRIASINISAGDDCPTGWNKSSYNSVSFCRAPRDAGGCYSTFFPTNGVSYQHVCGRARGYQKGSPDAFENHFSRTIDSYYVDGVSITHGNPRQHIWTYAVGLTENGRYGFCCNCPCAGTKGRAPPSFVGKNYYCESGTGNGFSHDAYYFSDPLWDGADCSASTCCSNTKQPWFYYKLRGMTQDNIEVRICRDQSFASDGILVDILELYTFSNIILDYT